jgi:hypothetical protein
MPERLALGGVHFRHRRETKGKNPNSPLQPGRAAVRPCSVCVRCVMDMTSPPLVPEGFDADVYVVLDDFGDIGRSYREVDEGKADRETLIRDLTGGQYNNPVRIVAFNTAQGWSRDVTTEIAREVLDRASAKAEELTGAVQEFVEGELERARRRASLAAHP